MLKESQKKLILKYNKEKILDIVQYGSSLTLEKSPNDIDIAVVFRNIPLKQQLEESQKIKSQLEPFFDKQIHIKAYDLDSFFDKGNFAKDSILFYGKSLVYGDYFSALFGILPKIIIKYNLAKFEKKQKIKFNYLLNGKGGEYGLLREYGGRLVAPGVIEIEPRHENIFLEAMKKLSPELIIEKIFIKI